MNTYNFPSGSTYLERAQGVKSTFDSYVTEYFTNILVTDVSESNYADVDFYISGKTGKAMTIRMYASDYPRLIIGDNNVYIHKSGYTLVSLIVTDNALVIIGNDTSSPYKLFAIYKTESDICAAGFYNNTHGLIRIDNGTNDLRSYSLLTGNATSYNQSVITNTTGEIIGVPIINNAAGASKDVYIPYKVPYASIWDPMKYAINDESYVSIGGGTFIVKSE